MKLSYRAVQKDGKIVSGMLDAKDVKEAVTYIRNKSLFPIKIFPLKEGGIASYIPFLHKASGKDLVFFTRQLASMITSGLTLLQALSILKDQIEKPVMRETVSNVIAEVEDGRPFSLALEKHSNIFSPIYVSLIKAAETSGLLDKVLLRLADNLEKQESLKSAIKSALMYPAIVVCGMVGIVIIMMVFVIPQLTVMYDQLDLDLPLPTQIVVSTSNFVVNFWPILLILGIVFFVFLNRWKKTESGKIILDEIYLKVPIFGKLLKFTILTEFTRTFGILVGSGALVVDALRQTADVTGNAIYKNAILKVTNYVEKGVTIADSMSTSSLFPTVLTQMTKIGEETGKLDESLLKVSEYFEREVDQSIKTLTSALEPIIIIALGVGVAFLIVSIITPIYNLTSSIK